jgi:mannosyltransferase OCH1-like enzyme
MKKRDIPKVINYCWFGNNEKSELILKCIASWKKYLPDYEIKEWNETNFNVNCCDYVAEAYKAKKWAFVSDYCRMWVLYNFGGVYFDTDVELIKSPGVIFDNPTIGFESKENLNPGLVFACEQGNWFCYEMLESYAQDYFYKEGKMNCATICDRSTKIFLSYGLRLNNKLQQIKGYNVYPSDYFNPMGSKGGYLKITLNTISIHNFAGTWIDDETKKTTINSFKGKLYLFLNNTAGDKFANKIRYIYKRITGGR